ncbi:MAG: ECF transporter S component [Turicibacter sp.]|nr:ECF transporter S component [Turicibacter sp.]
MNNKQKTRFMVLTAAFISIHIVMTAIPFLGFIPLGVINITTLHIPTILAGILLGVKGGATIGLTFGIVSVTNATLRPGLTSFLFSPLAPAPDGFSGNPLSLVIAIVPRVLLGVLAALIYQWLRNEKWKIPAPVATAITAVTVTLLHTVMVLGLIFVIFVEPYAAALSLAGSRAVLAFLGVVAVQNGIPEAILAGVLITKLVLILEPKVKRMMS